MGAGKLRGLACGAVAVIGLAALASACGGSWSPSLPQAAQAAAPTVTPQAATPTVTPAAVPVLGAMTFGPFPATQDGLHALALCEDWAGLRGRYLSSVRTDTPYQLEQWFSSAAWDPAFTSDSPLKTDPAYSSINAAFALVTSVNGAGLGSARVLDRACASAD